MRRFSEQLQDVAETVTYCSTMLPMGQSLTTRDTAVIRRAQQKRRSVLALDADSEWLSEYASNPRSLLSRMAQRGALVRLGGGRYAIAALGDPTIARLPKRNLVHAELSALGQYYIGFFSALVEHGLTDLSGGPLTVAIGFENGRLQRSDATLASEPVKVTRVGADLFDFGIDTVRLSRSERYVRSDLERTLLDCLMRPRLAGGAQTWMLAWGRALAQDRIDFTDLRRYANRYGSGAVRRTGALLRLAGRTDAAEQHFQTVLAPHARVLGLDGVSDLHGAEVMPDYRVAITPTHRQVEGWLLYGK